MGRAGANYLFNNETAYREARNRSKLADEAQESFMANEMVDPNFFEWDIHGRRFPKGQRPNAIKVAELLESVGDDPSRRKS